MYLNVYIIISHRMGGNASQLTEKDYQKMFQKLNVSHTKTLSYSDLCNAKNVPEKL